MLLFFLVCLPESSLKLFCPCLVTLMPQRDSKEKMKNPNFAVSLTRLSVHNIPRTMNSKQLKQVFIKFAGKPAPKEVS